MYPVRPFVAIAASRSGSASVVSAVPSDCSRSFVPLSISTTERACGVPVNSVRRIWGNCDTPEVSDSVFVRHLWFAYGNVQTIRFGVRWCESREPLGDKCFQGLRFS